MECCGKPLEQVGYTGLCVGDELIYWCNLCGTLYFERISPQFLGHDPERYFRSNPEKRRLQCAICRRRAVAAETR